MRSVLIVLLSVIASVAITLALTNKNGAGVTAKETAYDRVIRTGTIRCGYAMWPPHVLSKDMKTGELNGMFKDMIEELAANLSLKVEWTEETGWGSFIESLESDRFDLFCAPVWTTAERARHLRFTKPFAYSPVNLYVRADDTRFDGDDWKTVLNQPSMRLATLDGEMTQVIARNFFPKAAQVSLPGLADPSLLMVNVVDGKADGVFMEESLARDFQTKEPGKLKRATKEPFSIYPIVLSGLLEDEKLMAMIEGALDEMRGRGDIDRIIETYIPDRSIFLPVANSYTLDAAKAAP